MAGVMVMSLLLNLVRPKKKRITIRADFNSTSFPDYIISKA